MGLFGPPPLFPGNVQRTVYYVQRARRAAGPFRRATNRGGLRPSSPGPHPQSFPSSTTSSAGRKSIEPGVRVTFAMHPQTLDKQPITVEFDSDKFTENDCKAWLSMRNILIDYTFLPDQRDQTPTTQGNPRAEGEKPPAGFRGLEFFLLGYVAYRERPGGRGQQAVSRVECVRYSPDNRINSTPPSGSKFGCPACSYRFLDDDPDEPVSDEDRRVSALRRTAVGRSGRRSWLLARSCGRKPGHSTRKTRLLRMICFAWWKSVGRGC